MINRPNTKKYRRNRRAKWSNPIFVWLFVFLAMLIMVPIQAVGDDKPEPQQVQQSQLPEETTPEEPAYAWKQP